MHINFLLGPAGSGKTYRCLEEIRQELKASPEGLPLIFLAPRQATFQLESELLADPDLPGYTRLKIVSFDKLSELVLGQFGESSQQVLSEEGRVMVLRALLAQRGTELQLFHTTARLPGFAQQLSRLLHELQHFQVTPERLRKLAAQQPKVSHLQEKLHDIALLLQAYQQWIQENELLDAGSQLALAAQLIKQAARENEFAVAGLWMDGFAELSPQELELLAALIPTCQRATLAFCLDAEPEPDISRSADIPVRFATEHNAGADNNVRLPWHSIWSTVAQTFSRCRATLEGLPGATSSVSCLGRQPGRNRFTGNPVLAHLEESWASPKPFKVEATSITPLPSPPHFGRLTEAASTSALPLTPHFSGVPATASVPETVSTVSPSPLELYACGNPEIEATVAAREILSYVQEQKGRYRDVGVVVRSLEAYHHAIQRVFAKYDIPFFLDRRESISHHPLAELTRYALRVVSHGWEHEAWFGALKTGFVRAEPLLIEHLENVALASGWEGSSVWQNPLKISDEHYPNRYELEKKLERLRQEILPPFTRLAATLQATGRKPTGTQLARAIREFWDEMRVAEKLEEWGKANTGCPEFLVQAKVHSAARQELENWLQNLELGFPNAALSLTDWLAVLDSGLASLTVGVVPPALDQVLVGAVDRSRNPGLQMVIVLGCNELVFPAVPPPPVLLGEADREALSEAGLTLRPACRQQIGLERFLGYIACTRARQRLVLTFAQRDLKDKSLNPSVFIHHLQRLFPGLRPVQAPNALDWRQAWHSNELLAPILQNRPGKDAPHRVHTHPADSALTELSKLELFAPVLARWDQLVQWRSIGSLSAGLPEKLYSAKLQTSISDLEEYAACPFKFFIRRGLKAEERQEFATDPRERGSFQHEVLMAFHRHLQEKGTRWRELSPAQARELIGRIGEQLRQTFRHGIFDLTAERRFAGHALVQALQDCIEVLVEWAPQYHFDPQAVEIGFGGDQDPLEAWLLGLGQGHTLALRGRIDRVDLFRTSGGSADVVVIDYKSGGQKLEQVKLDNGLDLQLLAYLAVLRDNQKAREEFEASELRPAGAFYVGLRVRPEAKGDRQKVLTEANETRKKSYQHRGRFDAELLRQFDTRNGDEGDQFRYKKKVKGGFCKTGNEALTDGQFARELEKVVNFLRTFGQEIYGGKIAASPYRLAGVTACDHCAYNCICRFDPWLTAYRKLKRPDAASTPVADASASSE